MLGSRILPLIRCWAFKRRRKGAIKHTKIRYCFTTSVILIIGFKQILGPILFLSILYFLDPKCAKLTLKLIQFKVFVFYIKLLEILVGKYYKNRQERNI